MGGLFKSDPMPRPKPVRAPVEEDPDMRAAVRRRKEAAAGRAGRRETILSSNLSDATGKKLGG